MRISSHALFLALTADLQRHLPNVPEIYLPETVRKVILPPNSTLKSVASLSLLKAIVKKNSDDSTSSADTDAISLFTRMNEHCRDFKFNLFAQSEPVIHVLSRAKRLIEDWTCRSSGDFSFDLGYILSRGEFGPGASVLSSGSSFYHKVGSGPLSMTDDDLYSLYKESIRCCPTWVRAEYSRKHMFGRPHLVSGSKLATVPKDSKISRVICTEPSLNMFVQKGIASCLETVLRKSLHFDLAVQQFRNKRLARKGSRDGSIATIDLSSASDTISVALCNFLIPSSLLVLLETARSPKTTLPDGSVVDLHMISSMGNATTFPLQTIIFSALAYASYQVCGISVDLPSGSRDGNLGVFGDDLVVDTRVYDLLIASLSACGFFPNVSKSYNTGLFRESCGGDYFDGHEVRGVYCKTLLTTHSRYSLINRLNRWSAFQKIPLTHTIGLLLRSVRLLTVPPWDSDTSGVKVPLDMARNIGYGSNGSFRYKRLGIIPIKVDIAAELPLGKVICHRRKLVSNPDAILLAAVKGTLRNGSIGIRLDTIRTRYWFGVAPCWDYFGPGHDYFSSHVNYGIWKHMIQVNLCEVHL